MKLINKRSVLIGAAAVFIAMALVFTLNIFNVDAGQSNREHIVEIKNLEYIPSVLTVSPGDSITWINRDFIPHTVTANDETWDSGLIEPKGKWKIVVKDKTYEKYFCRYHPNMTAEFNIKE